MAGTRTNMGGNMGAAGGDTQEDNSPTYVKDATVRGFGEEATPSGRTVTSGLERNPTSLPLGAPTPARNSGAGSGPSAAMAIHNATAPTVL